MKQAFTLWMAVFGSMTAFAQLPYTWPTAADPGWTNAGPLQWRPGCSVVSTNCAGVYANNMNTTYTSGSINASCANASTVSVTFTANGNIEYGYDFLFIYYSLDNGATWINPYGVGVGWTGNFGAGTTIPPIVLPTSNNIRFRFNFQSDFSWTYTGVKITDFDVVCNVVLPIELSWFDGKRMGNENVLQWQTLSEKDNDYFDIEWSTDPEFGSWTSIGTVKSEGNSTEAQNYTLIHDSPSCSKINYYRITQTDFNGEKYTLEDMVAIDNSMKQIPVVKIINLLGQEVDASTPGLVIYVYEDGSNVKVYQ